jgi:hypothetical protein
MGQRYVHQEAVTMNLTANKIVLTNAIATAASGVLMLAARAVLYPYFGLESPLLLDLIAIGFIVYAGVMAIAARQDVMSRATLLALAAADASWVIFSVAVLVMFWPALDPIGRALIIAVALVVEVFATLQFAAARRSPALHAA